ncbi:MAG: hypothetical protein HY074_18205 [Deltaproteobacteria bacterium]|nr:hypothetical protein [Deltaproteobacteria bacterium]
MSISKNVLRLAVGAGLVAVLAVPAMARPRVIHDPNAPATKGLVHRMATETARDADMAADLANRIFGESTGNIVIPSINLGNGPKTEVEVRAVLAMLAQRKAEVDSIFATKQSELFAIKSLVDVKVAALEFRNALDAEPIYSQRPTLSVRAFQNLVRETNEMARNPLLFEGRGTFAQLNAEVRRVHASVQHLARFYQLAGRTGYRMAEVTILSEHLHQRVSRVLSLAEAERDWSFREARIVRMLRELSQETRMFTERALAIDSEIERSGRHRYVDIKFELGQLYYQINRRADALAYGIERGHGHSFPENVKFAFAKAEETLEELDYAFGPAYTPVP